MILTVTATVTMICRQANLTFSTSDNRHEALDGRWPTTKRCCWRYLAVGRMVADCSSTAQHSTAYTRQAMSWACDSLMNITQLYTSNAQHKHFSCITVGSITLQSNRSQNGYASTFCRHCLKKPLRRIDTTDCRHFPQLMDVTRASLIAPAFSSSTFNHSWVRCTIQHPPFASTMPRSP